MKRHIVTKIFKKMSFKVIGASWKQKIVSNDSDGKNI